ncbi:MAG: hypothetical protein ACYCTF_06060 [Acidiferrobacter sp.]
MAPRLRGRATVGLRGGQEARQFVADQTAVSLVVDAGAAQQSYRVAPRQMDVPFLRGDRKDVGEDIQFAVQSGSRHHRKAPILVSRQFPAGDPRNEAAGDRILADHL